MAKATANCTCKHCGAKFQVSAFRQNRREADEFERWAETAITECDDCRKARIAQEHAEKDAAAAKITGERNYPALDGSAKQIAWANSIRLNYIGHLDAMAAKNPNSSAKIAAVKEFVLRTYTTARFWIDHRNSHYDIDCRAAEDFLKAEQAAKPEAEEPAEAAAEPAEPAGASAETAAMATVREAAEVVYTNYATTDNIWAKVGSSLHAELVAGVRKHINEAILPAFAAALGGCEPSSVTEWQQAAAGADGALRDANKQVREVFRATLAQLERLLCERTG